jgi:hypothetical protein
LNKVAIDHIIERHNYPDDSSEASLIETHISWVVLTKNFAFKIKKPLQYSFLSFSTLEQRKFYCEQEVSLNRRLTDDIYLDVLPIRKHKDSWNIDGSEGTIVDYAVQMRKLDNDRRMDVLLEKEKVTKRHMEQLADRLARFHMSTSKIKGKFLFYNLWLDFADLLKVKDFISEHVGVSGGQKIETIVQFAKGFLKTHEERINQRFELGFTIDGHGDLHSRNIFLLDEPVIFDCIEFNDHFRQVDVLDELAFFCMDLDAFNQMPLELYFLEKYQLLNPCLFNEEDQRLHLYYKLYRANVRTKVNALKAMQETDPKELQERILECGKYLNLMNLYYSELCKP